MSTKRIILAIPQTVYQMRQRQNPIREVPQKPCRPVSSRNEFELP